MKKALVSILFTLVLLALFEPHVRESIVKSVLGAIKSEEEVRTETQVPSFTEHLGSNQKSDLLDVTLYYRFGQTGLLGAQRVELDLRREETIAKRIVQQLVEGPDISHDRLAGVFPQGTQVISVTGEGRTAFVTLSEAFLGKPDGAPADWEDYALWQEEAALRRRLAVQSLVLSLTEDGRYQRVQLYIADNDDDLPRRIAMAWFDPSVTDPTLVLAASPRDEKIMLTPHRAMTMILDAWQKRDFDTLYLLLAPESGESMLALGEFVAEMNEIDISLLEYETTQGTVSYDGQIATLVLDARIRSTEGGDAQIVRESVPLVRWKDNWAIEMDTLRSLMIRD